MEKFSNKPYFSYFEERKIKELDNRKVAERQKYEAEKKDINIREKKYSFVNDWDMQVIR